MNEALKSTEAASELTRILGTKTRLLDRNVVPTDGWDPTPGEIPKELLGGLAAGNIAFMGDFAPTQQAPTE